MIITNLESLANYYVDFLNNYLTVSQFADDNCVTDSYAESVINAGRSVYNQFYEITSKQK